jgi:hypothetical protein
MKLSRDDALNLFKNIKESGCYQSNHFQLRALQRGFAMEDVFEVAENGKISKRSPKYNAKYDNHTYTIMGKDVDGNRLNIVFTIKSDMKLSLITGYKS